MSIESDQPIHITADDIESILRVKRNALLMTMNPFRYMDIDSWKNICVMAISLVAFIVSSYFHTFVSPVTAVLGTIASVICVICFGVSMFIHINDSTSKRDLLGAIIPAICTCVFGWLTYLSIVFGTYCDTLNIVVSGGDVARCGCIFISGGVFIYSTIKLFENSHALANIKNFSITSTNYAPTAEFTKWHIAGQFKAPTYIINSYNSFMEQNTTDIRCFAYYIGSDNKYVSQDVVYVVKVVDSMYLIGIAPKQLTQTTGRHESYTPTKLTKHELNVITKIMKDRAMRTKDV